MSEIESDNVLARDKATLERFGYKQELARRMSGFGNFAMSFMTIGLFWALTVNMQQGIGTAGMFGISAMWIAGSCIAYCTAASLAEISSAIPTAGGLYHWSTVLGGRGWGWATAWINLLAYVFSQAGTAVATYLLFKDLVLGAVFGVDTHTWGYWHQLLGVMVVTTVWAIFNHVGVRTLARISEIGAYVSFVASAVLLGIMLVNVRLSNVVHIFSYVNNTGAAGGDVVPHTNNTLLVWGYALLLPMWIITAYDASAHVSEETVDASRSVPRAMVNATLLSAVLGFALLTIFGLAMPDQAEIARQGSNVFAALFQQVSAPALLKDFVVVSVTFTAMINGACAVTGFSRALFSFSRDRGLPAFFSRVSPRFRTPANAIWACAVAGIMVTLYSSAFDALAAGTALFYQICYAMAILVALFAKNRTYGPYRLGIFSKPFGLVGIFGGAFIVWVGLQPPTEILVHYCVGLLVLLVVAWYGFERRRFPGPPAGAFAASHAKSDHQQQGLGPVARD